MSGVARVTCFHLSVLTLTLCALAIAQDSVQISGTVQDPSGGYVKNACVTLNAFDSNSMFSVRTNGEGQFNLLATSATSYEVTVKAYGFKTRTMTVGHAGGSLRVPPIMLALIPYTLPIYVPTAEEQGSFAARVHREGSFLAREGCILDLDNGISECRDANTEPRTKPAADLSIKREGESVFLVPSSGATLGTGSAEGGIDDFCTAAHYRQERLPIDHLPEGAVVCVSTKEGRHAQLVLFFKEDVCLPGDIHMTFLIWKG